MHPLILLLWYYICGGRGFEIVTFVRDQLYAELTHYGDVSRWGEDVHITRYLMYASGYQTPSYSLAVNLNKDAV